MILIFCYSVIGAITNALDEAIALPTDFSAKIARDTQLYIEKEILLKLSSGGRRQLTKESSLLKVA